MLKKTKLVHEENRLANKKRFSIEVIQAMELWKTSGFFAEFFQRQNYLNSKPSFP